MAKNTLEDFKNLVESLNASQIIFVLKIGEILQSGKETVESLTDRLQVRLSNDKVLHSDCETQDSQMP